jgi:hypothetical protein
MYICSCEGKLLPAFLIPLKTWKTKRNHKRRKEGPLREGGTRRRTETWRKGEVRRRARVRSRAWSPQDVDEHHRGTDAKKVVGGGGKGGRGLGRASWAAEAAQVSGFRGAGNNSAQCCGSGMFIPDAGSDFFHPESRIRFFSIPDPGLRIKEFKYLTQNIVFKALGNMIRVVHSGSGSWFFTKDPRSATLFISTFKSIIVPISGPRKV